MFAIARAELRMLIRNRLVAACAILIPLGLAAVFLFQGNNAPSGGFTAVLQVMVMVSMGVYVTATTTLAARRQTLFLKRLRSGASSDSTIIAGLVSPIIAISVVQVAVVLGVLAVVVDTPAVPWLVVVAVLAVEALFAALALATAGVTNSPEHAQVTTIPLFFVTLGSSLWILLTGTEELGLVKRLLPGGAPAELLALGWGGGGGDLSAVPLLLAISIGWVVVGVVAARTMFRWEPRS